jgi:uncharacterized protein (TIGR02466 family)
MLDAMNTPQSRAAALVRQGFQAQPAGDTAAAASAYEAALAVHGSEPNALQLLGLLAGKRGDQAGAENYLRRSLQAAPEQPHVWNNLGNVLDRTARRDDAERCYARAVALAGNYTDALYNLARLEHARGAIEAAATLQRALVQPGGRTPVALQLKAQMAVDAGQLQGALETLDEALHIAPTRAALHHNRAVVLQRLQRPALALPAHEQALALGADTADVHYNRGNTLHSLGRPAQAAAAYLQALQTDPTHTLALFDLARLRWSQGESDFDAELRQAVAAHPSDPVLAHLHGQLLWRAERLADAAAVFGQGLTHAGAQASSKTAALHDGLGRCLVRVGELDAGLHAHARAVAQAPHDAELHTSHAASLLVAGLVDDALAAAQTACAIAPHQQQALALQLLAWRLQGHHDRANALCDVDRFVQVFDLPPPAGHTDMAAFNAALALELRGLHADRQAPVDQTLRRGTQTLGDLFEQSHPLVDALKARIGQAIDRYLTSLPVDEQHPFLGRRSSGWRFTDSWSSRLHRQGFHTDHVHPHGWISSVYYVAVPDGLSDHAEHEGWLQFGRPDLPLPGVDRDALVQRRVAPVPGRLVLFPSMLWHGTVPFTAAAERLTIAFDLVPA